MRLLFTTGLALSLAIATTAQSQEPCAQVATAISSQKSAPYRVDGELALACLQSAPLDTDNDIDLVKAIKGYSQFQSNLAYLRNPPPGALYPGVDVLAALDDIVDKLEGGHYDNEYDLQLDLRKIGMATHDFHYNIQLDITTIFTWRRSSSLISVSTDGVSLPDLYLYDDVNAIGNNAGYTPSKITKINGVDAETWVNRQASTEPYGQDPDGNYNAVLYNVPSVFVCKVRDSFSRSHYSQGSDTIITFDNGTTKHIDTAAYTAYNFKNVVDGKSFFNQYCTGKSGQASATTSTCGSTPTRVQSLGSFTAVSTQSAIPVPNGPFGQPLVIAPDYSVAGYLPDAVSDLAVLQIPTFLPAYITAFQNTVRELLATAQKQGRTKLLIDLRGNGGGDIYLGYDTFRQIFPSMVPYGSSQERSTPLFREMISVIDTYYRHPTNESELDGLEEVSGTVFDDLGYLDANDQNFTSAQAFYGPYNTYGDNFTALERTFLNSTRYTDVSVYGYGNNKDPIPQVFDSSNIVLLQDALCGSTCALFSEFMKSQGLVKSIAVGGRRQTGPMQGIGGSKGAQDIDGEEVDIALNFVQQAANDSAYSIIDSLTDDFAEGIPTLLNRTAHGTALFRLNFKNNIRQNDTSLTPLQFVYEATDCRFFYTAPMINDQTKVWKMAHDIHWGTQLCVAGSAGHPSSLSGDLLSNLGKYPPVGANYTWGNDAAAWPSGVSGLQSSPTVTATPTATAGANAFGGTTSISSATTATAAPSQSPSGGADGRAMLVDSGVGLGGLAVALAVLIA